MEKIRIENQGRKWGIESNKPGRRRRRKRAEKMEGKGRQEVWNLWRERTRGRMEKELILGKTPPLQFFLRDLLGKDGSQKAS